MMAQKKTPSFVKVLPYILIAAGIIGIVCSLILVHDQIEIWHNPSYHPACGLNPVISCGNVINSNQGHILGFPSPFFGLLFFPVLLTVGVSILAGARFKRWYWQSLEIAGIGGVIFALWLFFLSVYKVHALCPYCLGVDVTVYITVWYLTLYNLEKRHIKLPLKLSELLRRYHLDIIVFWFVILIVFTLHHFWYYYGKHL